MGTSSEHLVHEISGLMVNCEIDGNLVLNLIPNKKTTHLVHETSELRAEKTYHHVS
jgi:hypothetical protein